MQMEETPFSFEIDQAIMPVSFEIDQAITAVSFAVDLLHPLLTEESNLPSGIHREIAIIIHEFGKIEELLKDAERRTTTEGEIWVKQVMELAFRIEDIFDEYNIYVGQQPRDPRCLAKLTKIAHLIKTMMHRQQIKSEIHKFRSTVIEIRQRRKRYSFETQHSSERGSSTPGGSQNQWHDSQGASLCMEDAELVGFEAPERKLIGWLVAWRKELTVISVVGSGGQGKTALVNRVFKNQEVTEHFDCHAWITVSQSYNVQGLLRDILKKFCKENREDPPWDISEMDLDQLIQEVRNYLIWKSCVVVFDDVWDVKLWDEIKFALLDNKMGSRILITTRSMEVAMFFEKFSFSQVHVLQPLTHEKSLELFHKKVLPHFNGWCPYDLLHISSDIVRKCKGLPLAIVVISGILSRKKKSASKWKRFRSNLCSELEKDSSITKVLDFSYDDLPNYLKSCLLYFGIYPENYEVRCRRLVQQWIIEGFVKHEKGKTLEEVAEQCLTELIGRSLVQVSSCSINGKAKYCRVHDLTRDMILKKCKDLNFCQYISGDDESMLSGIVRRQSIATSSCDFLESTKLSRVRSLFFFSDVKSVEGYMTKFLQKYKLLKILDLEGVNGLDYFPENLEKFIHLKYLSFRGAVIGNANLPQSIGVNGFDYFPENLENFIHLNYLSFRGAVIGNGNLPQSIGKLQNLETLDLKNTYIKILPKEIFKLKKLRHLLCFRMSSIGMKDGIGGMISLQTLKHVIMSGYREEAEVMRELRKLRQLNEVSFTIHIRQDDGSGLCCLLNEMQQMEKQGIFGKSTNEQVLNQNLVSSPPKLLLKILLAGKLNKLPEEIQELKNLVRLSLYKSYLIEDPLKSLQNLPNLSCLRIEYRSYSGEGLHFEEGGFQNLKKLVLDGLLNLESIIIENGAMSSLKVLHLWALESLKSVPNGIRYLKKLQLLNMAYLPTHCTHMVAAYRKDYWIIQHVPRVQIQKGTKRLEDVLW